MKKNYIGERTKYYCDRVEENEMGWAYGTRRREGGANIV